MRLLSAAREAIKVTHTEDDGEGEVEEGVNEDGEEEEAGGDGAEGEVGEEAEHEGAGGANEEEDGGGVDEETAEEENQERFELDLKVTKSKRVAPPTFTAITSLVKNDAHPDSVSDITI